MTFMRNLWRDLVDKRLWPVAAALVVALIAVPVLVGGGSSNTPAPAAAPAVNSTATPGAQAQVSLDTSTSTKAKDRAGAVRDPFKPLHVVQPTTTTATGATPAATGATPSATTPKTPSTTTPNTSTTTPGGSTTTSGGKLIPLEWVARVRIGSHTSMKTHSVHGVSPLPSSAYVLLTYLGVKTDLKTAVFSVTPGTLVTGGGTCSPTPVNCSLLALKAGDSALLTRRAGATHLKRYRVRLLSLRVRRMTVTKGKASAARAARSLDVSTLVGR